MPSRYYKDLSCTSCDYKERITTGPIGKEPIEGVYKVHIEYRWCHNCQGVRNIFTGIGGRYNPYEIPEIRGLSIYDKEEIIEQQKEIKTRIRTIEQGYALTKKKKIRILNLQLFDINQKIIETSIIQGKVSEYNRLAKSFYDHHKPNPKCLECQSSNVSSKSYTEDFHTCGGKFIITNPHKVLFGQPLHVFLEEYPVYQYDAKGFAKKKMKKFF